MLVKELPWPVCTADGIPTLLKEIGVQTWPEIRPRMPLNQYLEQGLEQRATAEQYFPVPEVAFFRDPRGNTFDAGMFTLKPHVTIVAVIDDYVPVTIAFKHVCGITIVPVCGVLNKEEHMLNEMEGMRRAALREWQEETGTELEDIEFLGVTHKQWNRYYEFLGRVKKPISVREQYLDEQEFDKIVLFHWKEWLKVLHRGSTNDYVIEDCAITTTYRAFHRLGLINILG